MVFFEDIKSHIKNEIPARYCIVGIGKLSEINEVYGYDAGNKVIQHFGRYLMDHVGKPIELDNILDGLQSDAGALCFRKNG